MLDPPTLYPLTFPTLQLCWLLPLCTHLPSPSSHCVDSSHLVPTYPHHPVIMSAPLALYPLTFMILQMCLHLPLGTPLMCTVQEFSRSNKFVPHFGSQSRAFELAPPIFLHIALLSCSCVWVLLHSTYITLQPTNVLATLAPRSFTVLQLCLLLLLLTSLLS